MMIDSVKKTLEQLFSPPFRQILVKSVGLTISILAAIGLAAYGGIQWLLGGSIGEYLAGSDIFNWILGLGLVVGLAFLIGPTTTLFAGLFTDEIADAVEQRHYKNEKPGTPLPLGFAIAYSVRFTIFAILVNLLALLVFLIPGVNLTVFFVANGYLLGREYFEFAAMRHLPINEAKALRRKNGMTVFVGGLIIAGVMAIPLVNLLTPLFATAFMVHIYKRQIDHSSANR